MSAPASTHPEYRRQLDELGRALVVALDSAAERQAIAGPSADGEATASDQQSSDATTAVVDVRA